MFQNVSVSAVMAQTFLPGVTNRYIGVSRREIRRRHSYALGVTLGRYTLVVLVTVLSVSVMIPYYVL